MEDKICTTSGCSANYKAQGAGLTNFPTGIAVLILDLENWLRLCSQPAGVSADWVVSFTSSEGLMQHRHSLLTCLISNNNKKYISECRVAPISFMYMCMKVYNFLWMSLLGSY